MADFSHLHPIFPKIASGFSSPPNGFGPRGPQVVTLELRSLEQRLNHGSVSAGAMDEANEAMAKAGNATGERGKNVNLEKLGCCKTGIFWEVGTSGKNLEILDAHPEKVGF